MAYGWAILVVVAVGVILWMMGVFSPKTVSQPIGFEKLYPDDWSVHDSNQLTMHLINRTAFDLNIQSVVVDGTTLTCTVNGSGSLPAKVSAGGEILLDCNTLPDNYPAGTTYTLNVQINYVNISTGISQSESGKLAGTAV